MSRTEHERALASALQTSERMQALFDALGSKTHPARGVWAAYAMARQTLVEHLSDTRLVNRTLAQLRETSRALLEKQIAAAVRAGEKQAAREIALYDELHHVDADTDALVDAAMLALDGELDGQLAQVRALIMTGADEGLLFGDAVNLAQADRTGVLRASDVTAAAMQWIAATVLAAYTLSIETSIAQSKPRGGQASARGGWMKQAIVAIDKRTTDCCLRVSGQTVPLDGKFRLTGTPRYADEMDGPPFHGYCRTATALVRAADAGDDLTRALAGAAQAELNARANKDKRDYVFPVDAFGGRI